MRERFSSFHLHLRDLVCCLLPVVQVRKDLETVRMDQIFGGIRNSWGKE